MDQLKQMIMDRAGISDEQADKVVDTVKNFLTENPDQLKGLLGGQLGGITDKLGGLLGR